MTSGVSAREFALNLRRFGDVTEKQATMIIKKIILVADSGVVLMTPVDTGRARGNWYPSLEVPSTAMNMAASDKGGNQTIASISAKLPSFKLGGVFWMTNNLPYILPLENGHSKQAPEGMVDLTLARIAARYGGVVR